MSLLDTIGQTLAIAALAAGGILAGGRPARGGHRQPLPLRRGARAPAATVGGPQHRGRPGLRPPRGRGHVLPAGPAARSNGAELSGATW